MFFAWGDPNGHTENSGYSFSVENYENSPASSISQDLTGSNDMATANLGEPCRLPTSNEFQELADNCSHIWTTLNGVYGLLFTSNVNSNVLFFPATGLIRDDSHDDALIRGFYWTSEYNSMQAAHCLNFNYNTADPNSNAGRRLGFPVRAVKGAEPNRSVIPPTPEDEPKEEETPTTEEPKDKDER